MRTVALAGVLVLAGLAGTEPLQYRLETVKSRVVVGHEGEERRAAAGDTAVAGDSVRTGSFGRTVIAAPHAAARFEVGSRTEVVLAGPEPGVLLTVRSGVVKAFFDALTGRDDRLVATPGALLAVRGTRYGVEVGSDGEATLAVFEGVVEVRSRLAGVAPVEVRAGEQSRFGPRLEPGREAMPRGWSEERWRGADAATGRPDEAGGAPGQAPAGQGPDGRPGGPRR